MPDYDIIEWNEDNFDVNLYPYAKEALDEVKISRYSMENADEFMAEAFLSSVKLSRP